MPLPKLERDAEETAKVCMCRPVCKSRRREWKGKMQSTSAELMIERKPLAECFRRWPMKIFPNGLCPLFGKSHRVTIIDRNAVPPPNVVRICQAPIDDTVDLPYLAFAELAQEIGAWSLVKSCCAFCNCCGCCACDTGEYAPLDAERAACRRADMRAYDARVKDDCLKMRIMYDKNAANSKSDMEQVKQLTDLSFQAENAESVKPKDKGQLSEVTVMKNNLASVSIKIEKEPTLAHHHWHLLKSIDNTIPGVHATIPKDNGASQLDNLDSTFVVYK